MSPRPLRADPDLVRLVDDGYDVDVVAGYLVVRNVPFVDAARRVRRGFVVSTLNLAGDRAVPPVGHTGWFGGGLPCDEDGRPLVSIMTVDGTLRDLGGGLIVDAQICSRPAGGDFSTYYGKMTTLASQVAVHAEARDPTALVRTERVMVPTRDGTPFAYVDTASARAGVGALARRFLGQRVGIVGLGGTGAYVLDLVAKTPVARIHLFDDDEFLQHNAFRCPGAASMEELASRPVKVQHLDRVYSRLHRGIVPHRARLGPGNLHLLDHLDFVFLCIDRPAAKPAIVEALEARGLPFVDCGMGLHMTERGLVGAVRVTTSTPEMRDHVRGRVAFDAGPGEDVYATRVQVAELNALNATLAVIRWKKTFGFYADLEGEHHATYSVDGNWLLNEDAVGGPE